MSLHRSRRAPGRARQKLRHPGPKNARILLANLLQRSRSTFSWGSFLNFFAFNEGMLDTPISALGGWPTVSARYLHTAVGVQQFPPGVSNNSLRIHCAVNPIAKPLLIARTAQPYNATLV